MTGTAQNDDARRSDSGGGIFDLIDRGLATVERTGDIFLSGRERLQQDSRQTETSNASNAPPPDVRPRAPDGRGLVNGGGLLPWVALSLGLLLVALIARRRA